MNVDSIHNTADADQKRDGQRIRNIKTDEENKPKKLELW